MQDPRAEVENFGHMICQHRRYALGDSWDEMREALLTDEKCPQGIDILAPEEMERVARRLRWVVLPLYLKDHTILRMGTTPFYCRYDSGRVGFIAVSPTRGRAEYGRYWRDKARLALINEVKDYDRWLCQ